VSTGRIRREPISANYTSEISADKEDALYRFLPIFVDVKFESFGLGRSGFTIGLNLRAPPKARSQKSDYWESKAGLSKGHLVALVWDAEVFIGTVASSESHKNCSKSNRLCLIP
jgi:hypothetical protein